MNRADTEVSNIFTFVDHILIEILFFHLLSHKHVGGVFPKKRPSFGEKMARNGSKTHFS
jgi:hypothetical protein